MTMAAEELAEKLIFEDMPKLNDCRQGCGCSILPLT